MKRPQKKIKKFPIFYQFINFMYEMLSCVYRHVTRLIRPWNPWFTSVVVDVFRSIFNTALINVGGKAACALSGITQSTQCGHTGTFYVFSFDGHKMS